MIISGAYFLADPERTIHAEGCDGWRITYLRDIDGELQRDLTDCEGCAA